MKGFDSKCMNLRTVEQVTWLAVRKRRTCLNRCVKWSPKFRRRTCIRDSATSTSFPVRLVEFFLSSWPLLSPKEILVSPEDFLPRKGSSEGLGKGDLQSGPAGAANAELVIERLVLGRAEDGRYLQPWPD